MKTTLEMAREAGWDAHHAEFDTRIERFAALVREDVLAQPEPPPECKTEAEKIAFAFGWFKALEQQRLATVQEPVAMRMPKVGDKIVCIEDESLATVVSLTAGGSPDIVFSDGSRGTYLLREFAELFGYITPPETKPAYRAVKTFHDGKPVYVAQTEQTSAERTLQALGYINNGGEFWKPPLGKVREVQPEQDWEAVAADQAMTIALMRSEQEPVAFKIYKPTPPRHAISNVRDAELPWVYDQDPSSGNVASMLVTPVNAIPTAAQPEQETVAWERPIIYTPPHMIAAQPEQEPVAWMTITAYGDEDDIWYENPEGKLIEGWTYKPLYTTPPQRKPLTGEEIEFAWMKVMQSTPGTALPIHEFARAIETKLKEKNT